jgi:hypothetical protein
LFTTLVQQLLVRNEIDTHAVRGLSFAETA